MNALRCAGAPRRGYPGGLPMFSRTVVTVATLVLTATGTRAQPLLDSLGDPLPPGAAARLGTLRFQHPVGNDVTAAVYSHDGKHIATRGRTGGVYVWDAATGKLLHRFDGPGDTSPQALAFAPDGAALAAGVGNDIALWDLATGKVRQ